MVVPEGQMLWIKQWVPRKQKKNQIFSTDKLHQNKAKGVKKSTHKNDKNI